MENNDKETLVDACQKIVQKIYKIAPPINKDGKVDYYIAGSLITNVLPKIKIMNNYKIGVNGHVEKIDTIIIENKSKESFLECVRPSVSKDIDIVCLGNDPYIIGKKENGFPPSAYYIREGIEEEFDLMFLNRNGDLMDRLESVEELEEFEMSESILEDGTKIYMPTLLSILKFKAREVSLLEDKQKEEDLNKLVNAIKLIYDENIINEILSEYKTERVKK